MTTKPIDDFQAMSGWLDHNPQTATHRAVWNRNGKTAGYGTLKELEERRRQAANIFSPEIAYAHGGKADFRIVRIDNVKVASPPTIKDKLS